MAIYKPSNFYPHLQEIDLTQENTFSCQVNTDGAMVSAARLTISSEDNILVYENLYQFVDIDGNKDPIENKGFMELPMEPYQINSSNISFGLIDNSLTPVYYKYAINDSGKKIYYDEYGENGKKIGFPTYEEAFNAQVYDEDGKTVLDNYVVENDMLDNYNKKVVIIKDINFITLHPEVSYDIRKDYCPYNFYNVKLKDAYCFGLKFVNKHDENDVKISLFKNMNYEKTDMGYNITIYYDVELQISDISQYDCYIVLLNDKDYTWDIKMYEHLFSEYVDKGTLVTDGYIAGSTKTVFWWDDTKQTEDTILNRKEIKENYYVEINATEDNSDIFKEQLKLGRTMKGVLSIDGEEGDVINNEDLLKIENSLDPICNIRSNSSKYFYSTPLPSDSYKILETGQKVSITNFQRWKFTQTEIFEVYSPYLRNCISVGQLGSDFFLNTNLDTETYYFGRVEKLVHFREYMSKDANNRTISQIEFEDDSYGWYEISDVFVDVEEKNGIRKFKILENSTPKIRNAVARCRNVYLNSTDETEDGSNYWNYLSHWKCYDVYGNIYYSSHHSSGSGTTQFTASCIGDEGYEFFISNCILNQDFYHYPFLFDSSETKVVGFPKTYLTNFYNECKNENFKTKIAEVISFYENNYLIINIDGSDYYAKVFTPRPFSNFFYRGYDWRGDETYDEKALSLNYNCLKYPSILEGNEVLFDTTYMDKQIYPNPYQGEIVAPYDNNEETKWTKELITTEDDIAAFLGEGDYATALSLPTLQKDGTSYMPSSLKYEKYFSLVYPPVSISDNVVLKTKIVAQDLDSRAINNELYSEIDVFGGKTYEVSGLLKISGLELTNEEFQKYSDIFSCRIFEKTDSSQYVDYNISDFNNYIKYETIDGIYYKFSFKIIIPLLFTEPVVKLNISMRTLIDLEIERSVIIYNLIFTEIENNNKEKHIYLNPNTVDISNYEDSSFIHTIVSNNNASDSYREILGERDFKIKNYIKSLNSFEFEDKKIQDLFTTFLSTNEINPIVDYYLFYKKREKVTWITEKLGFNKNINKIEVENDFDVNLKDSTKIDLYGGNNKNTYYSFYGVRDSDINVEDIYVRFPGYQGLDFNGNYIIDTKPYYDDDTEPAVEIYEAGATEPLLLSNDIGLKGCFYQRGEYYSKPEATEPDKWENDISQPVSLYGRNVSMDVFEKNNSNIFGYIETFDKSKVGTKNCFTSITIISPENLYNPDSADHLKIFDTNNNVLCNIYAKNAGENMVTLSINEELNRWELTLTSGIWYNNITSLSNNTDAIDPAKVYYWKNDKIEISFGLTGISSGIDTVASLFDINFGNTSEHIGSSTTYLFNKKIIPESYCKLFKVTSYDYETGEFIIAGGLEREILNTDKYEIWQRTVNESMTNEYNITEVAYQYTRLYPPSENYNEVAYVGDTKILKDGIKIMNNTNSRVFIQPNINFYSDEYNYPYLYLDNYGQRLEFPYNYIVYDDGFTIQDKTIETLDGSQWLLSYNTTSGVDITPGLTYKLYMDTCKSTPSNWFYGRNIANITMRVGEYNYIQNQLDKGYVRPIDFTDFKQTFNDISNKKIGNNCLVQCVDAYFMGTYDQLSVPIKRYRYKFYDSSMNLINDSGYIYDNHISYGIRGLRNEEIYLLHFEMEDQLGYVYHYEEKIIVKYIEYNTNIIQLQLTNNASQGCIMGDFVTMVEADDDVISERDTYDEDGNIIKKGSIIKKGTIYAELCKQSDFINNLSLNPLAENNIFIYRRNKEKLLSFVCKINLFKDQIITGREESDHKYGFIDYGVYNNEYYDYVVILKQKDLTTDSHLGNMEYIYSESRCKTSFNGWILVDIEKDDDSDSYYVSDQVWNFKYNLESQDLTQNTSVSKWDTLGKYANVYIGQKNYVSSGLSCLLGDVGIYYTYNGDKLKERFGYFEQPFKNVDYDDIHNIISTEILTNNVDKYLAWKTFNSNGNPKLLKDYKGNVWIVQIMENPTVKNADNSKEQIYTISFNWVEIMDWREFPILGKNINFDREESAQNEMNNILEAWDYSFDSGDIYYNLSKVRDDYAFNNVTTYETPLIVFSRITLENNSMTGILNDSYLGNILLESEKQFLSMMSDSEVKNIYDSQSDFISPLKTKQLDDTYNYSSGLEYLDFEQSLLYENGSIDFLCCRMNALKGININLTDGIKTARYAFAGTSIFTDSQYQIQINTNNYINTYGMLDDLQGDGKITVKWGTLAEDPDLVTYAELYERYWDNDKIVLDCKLNFNINDWIVKEIIEETGSIDGTGYDKKIVLNSYDGTLTSVYIPKFYKDSDGVIYLIELSENFNI